ncbi:class I SAM-dependent methyltransferase [Candidatus Daviesbacteria bacterium]|nr:class I SAM-dependent methyltransferase [Candidatus Daviesbacteria bacterium]
MPKKNSSYYLKNSSDLGWGENSVQLDKQRVDLLKKFVVGKRVLDVGCGLGVYVDFLTSWGKEAWGVDFVGEFIKKRDKPNFVRGRAEKLPFKDKEFDTVILFDILEHGDDQKILAEAKRVARSRILIIVPRVVDKNLADSGVVFRHYLDKSHLREYDRVMINSLSSAVKLKLRRLEVIHPLYNATIFLALFEGNIIWRKIIRKIVWSLLPKKAYPTEWFAVLDK